MLVINGSFLAQPPTGVQRFAIEISKELKRISSNVEVVVPKNAILSRTTEALSPKIIGRFTNHLWEQIDLYRYVRRKKALLLNLDMKGPLLYRNKIITIHDLNFLHNPRWVSPKFHCFYKFLTRVGAQTSRLVLTVSQFSKEEIQRHLHVPASRVVVVYNAIANLDPVFHKDRYIADDYILSVSSTHPRKNLDRLIQAFQQLSDPTTKLVLVGLPHQGQSLSDISHKNVVFLGHIEDDILANLYQHAVAFVYPSLYEGFGIPPLEAMYFGCPVVASNTSSIPEVCGEAVLYVDPNSTDSLLEGLREIMRNVELRKKLIDRGHERLAHFSWAASAKTIAEEINHYL